MLIIDSARVKVGTRRGGWTVIGGGFGMIFALCGYLGHGGQKGVIFDASPPKKHGKLASISRSLCLTGGVSARNLRQKFTDRAAGTQI